MSENGFHSHAILKKVFVLLLLQLNVTVRHMYMSHFASACKTEGQNGISRLISELLRTLDSSLRDRLFVLQNEVSELPNHAAC